MSRAALNHYMGVVAATEGRAGHVDQDIVAEIEHEVGVEREADRETERARLTADDRAEVAEVVASARRARGRGRGRSALDAVGQAEVAHVVARARRAGGKWVTHRG